MPNWDRVSLKVRVVGCEGLVLRGVVEGEEGPRERERNTIFSEQIERGFLSNYDKTHKMKAEVSLNHRITRFILISK